MQSESNFINKIDKHDGKVITMCVTCNETLFSHRIASNPLQREGRLFTFSEGHSSLKSEGKGGVVTALLTVKLV